MYFYVLITRTPRPRVLVIDDTPWATYLHISSFLLTSKIRLILTQCKEMFIPSAPKTRKETPNIQIKVDYNTNLVRNNDWILDKRVFKAVQKRKRKFIRRRVIAIMIRKRVYEHKAHRTHFAP